MSHIQTVCNTCQSKLKAKLELAGKTVKCPKCASAITVPNPTETPSESPSPPPESSPTKANDKKPDIPPATEKQKDYARKLGVTFPENVNRRQISDLIDKALASQDDARYQRLDDLQNKESKVREELRQEIIVELDEDDPRVSIATPAQMIEGLENRDMGAILVIFDPDADPDDLTDVKILLNYTETIDMDMVKAVVRALYVMTR